ncbi:MAG: carboxypeptidase-like regulatory domain-containing protein, partial [Deltaproteobacteria bacterium]|nr:carboxypeptidase-like regulatory domain-containing protein [Deltaproteobacteria bacterium]
MQIKGTTTGTTSDFDGRFTLLNLRPENILVISFLGYDKQEITVGDTKNFSIQLIENAQQL